VRVQFFEETRTKVIWSKAGCIVHGKDHISYFFDGEGLLSSLG
jgi:hypothetical protein